MPCAFLGYYEGTKSYHLMCLETKIIMKSRDAMFIEGSKEIGGVLHPKKVENVVVDEIMNKEVEREELLTFSWDTPLNEITTEGVQSKSTPKSSSKEELVVSHDNPSNVPRERPQRQRKEWPQNWWIATKEVERATVAFLEEPQNIKEALTCENSKEWECAMQEEYNSLMANNTWTLVPLHVGRKPISCKWVFKIKQGVNGEVERYKARLVARGFT